jgi:hypothetical protein
MRPGDSGVGVCAASATNIFGCYAFVEAGIVGQEICAD